MDSNPPPFAVVVLADELAADPGPYMGKLIRVLGRVDSINPIENVALVSLAAARPSKKKKATGATGAGQVAIDLTLVGASTRTGSLCQFVGELEASDVANGTTVVVKAVMGRCVDGLDVPLFREALALRRIHVSAPT